MKTGSETPKQADEDWRCGGWSDHQRTRFDATYGTSLLERLIWLEEAAAFARQLGGSRPVQPPAFVRVTAVAEDAGPYPAKKDHPA